MTTCCIGYVFSSSFKGRIKMLLNCLLLLFVLPLGMSDSPFTRCNKENYTSGSGFENNLNTVLQYLVNNASRIGFNSTTYGQSPNRIYGFIQCRLDKSGADCYNCSQEALKTVRQACPKAVGALVWFTNCFLRYDNHNFISELDDDALIYYWAVANVSDFHDFDQARRTLMSNLQIEASIPANKSFATGQIVDNSYRTIYGMVFCLRYLSIMDCQTCLSTAISQIPGCCKTTPGARLILASCFIQFETHQFSSSARPYDDEEIPRVVSTPSPRLSPPAKYNSTKSTSSRLLIILGVAGGLLLALSVVSFTVRKNVAASLKRIACRGNHDAQEEPSDVLPTPDQMMFDLNTLIVATANFHNDNKLGEGGFGPVYKGRIPDGREIAVKKLSVSSGQGRKEFLNEVKLVARIQHRNLVKLLGCCAQGPEMLLVYEYLPNKSLDTVLFDREKSRSLGWEKRYNIILGIARGMLYLHEDSEVRIVHRDIKASNILLDEKLNPKISDFGMARLFPDDQTQLNTRIAGTYGYMAPEYAMQGKLSVKADIFSFGVLLLEIVSGRKSSDFNQPPHMQVLLPWVWALYKRGNALDAMDSALGDLCFHEQILRCIHVGLLCAQADERLRPTMSSIVVMLVSNSVTLPDPTEPGFVNDTHIHASSTSNSIFGPENGRERLRAEASTSASGHSRLANRPCENETTLLPSSRNEVSITELQGR